MSIHRHTDTHRTQTWEVDDFTRHRWEQLRMVHQACSDYPSAVFLREGEESPESRKAIETFSSSASGRDLQEDVVSGT